MTKSSDFRQKEVINIKNGRRLGYVIDMEFNLYEGRITAIVVPGANKILGFLKGDGDLVIPWEKIKRIGDDVILVDKEQIRVGLRLPIKGKSFASYGYIVGVERGN